MTWNHAHIYLELKRDKLHLFNLFNFDEDVLSMK